jgi:hypothetical protein
MIFNRYRDLFEDCAPAFWPWLWLQLYLLLAQKADDGRERLIMVTWWGHVFVLAVGDDPHAAPRATVPDCSVAYRAICHARFPGDSLDLIAQPDAVPACDPLRPFAPFAAPRIEKLTDKSFVTAPG